MFKHERIVIAFYRGKIHREKIGDVIVYDVIRRCSSFSALRQYDPSIRRMKKEFVTTCEISSVEEGTDVLCLLEYSGVVFWLNLFFD